VKADFLFVGLNINIIIQKKMRQKEAHFVDDALKSRGIIYFNANTLLLFSPPIKISGYAPPQNRLVQSFFCFQMQCFVAHSSDQTIYIFLCFDVWCHFIQLSAEVQRSFVTQVFYIYTQELPQDHMRSVLTY